jgi:hypothetical protein
MFLEMGDNRYFLAHICNCNVWCIPRKCHSGPRVVSWYSSWHSLAHVCDCFGCCILRNLVGNTVLAFVGPCIPSRHSMVFLSLPLFGDAFSENITGRRCHAGLVVGCRGKPQWPQGFVMGLALAGVCITASSDVRKLEIHKVSRIRFMKTWNREMDFLLLFCYIFCYIRNIS